jgi:hypothetical protein
MENQAGFLRWWAGEAPRSSSALALSAGAGALPVGWRVWGSQSLQLVERSDLQGSPSALPASPLALPGSLSVLPASPSVLPEALL